MNYIRYILIMVYPVALGSSGEAKNFLAEAQLLGFHHGKDIIGLRKYFKKI